MDSLIFSSPNSERGFSGTEVLKEVVAACPDLEFPERIHSQRLRTYLATTCQVLKMDKDELRLLIGHMGHEKNIHFKHYAQQTTILEKAKVARILTAINTGGIAPCTNYTNGDELDIVDSNLIDSGKMDFENIATEKDITDIETTGEGDVAKSKQEDPERRRWTEDEVKQLLHCWNINSGKLPSKDEMDIIEETLPNRHRKVIRAKAQHLLKKSCK